MLSKHLIMKKRIFFCAFLLFCRFFLSFSQQKIAFKIGKIPASKSADKYLFLAGDFNNWSPADTNWELDPDSAGEYRLQRELNNGIYHFKITRGSWQTVECSEKGMPIDNRVIRILHDTTIVLNVDGWQDNFKAAEKQHTASAQVHIISQSYNIPQLSRERRIWMYLPADYKTSKRKYAVIYMQDGQNLFDAYTSGYGEWGIDEIMDKLPEKDNCIIVGIDHGGDYRITEYDPYDSKYGKGRGDDYVDFLIKTLKPYIDGHYRTKTDAKHTTIAGSSMGGLISMYAAVKYPHVFGNAGVFSPAFWIAPGIFAYVKQNKLPVKSGFYFVCGDAESETMVADMQNMARIVREKGVPQGKSPVVIVKGAAHNEKQWNGDFSGFYSWLIKGGE